ncbi:hypothetical protein [Desulfoscipio geothermicus]|uniref:Uncharacterized protein n=1 Tax=Desulfoscipio geothermicus DSM 3669 TaxID=1121426 RepID=A0A1I6E4J8_9FIRM|nr:hypothetical protein [Desulfoscipio geothermicus]SFR12567.1 hypothetical protein SAMN05660706_12554 [Desulfoscipio geothermicus DSM 3669]
MWRAVKIILMVLLLVTGQPAGLFAASPTWEYRINSTDTPTMLDASNTTAEIDTSNNEIRLPKYLPSAVSFWPDGGPDFAALAPNKVIHYSYDQASGRYVENGFLSVNLPENPLAVVAVEPYPEMVVITKNNSYHFSFDGSGMVNNPALAASGLANVFAAGARETDKAGLRGNAVEAYSFNGLSTQPDSSMEPAGPFSQPVDLAMYPDRRGIAVGERDKIRAFLYTGTSMLEVAYLSLNSGISNLKDVSLGESFRIAAIVENQQKEWGFDIASGSMKEIPMLGITSGLSKPKCVALRPGTFDRVVLDGSEYRYYRWNGSSLVYDSSLSVTVSGYNLGFYSASETAISKPQDPGWNAEKVRVRAYHTLPDGTSATWSVTADGINWVTRWRVRGTGAGTVAEISDDNGANWTVIGDASLCTPDTSNDTRTELYADTNPGRNIQWKVLLETNDINVTPVISPVVSGGIAVKWEAGNPPDQPVVTVPIVGGGSCFTTSTPTIEWNYNDPDGDPQGAYQIHVKRKSDGTLIYDSGKVLSSNNSHQIPTSNTGDTPGVLWSSGTHKFTVEIKVWDSTGLESEWCPPAEFCVVAFDRPRIAEIVSPPAGQEAPDPADPSTHIVIEKGTAAENLPKVKAGARVKLLVDSIGPVTLPLTKAEFPYLTKKATVKSPVLNYYPDGNEVNRWEIDFWTDANLEICPTGTIVEMQLAGDAGADGIATLNAPTYAAGVIQTQGSIYEDWFTVVQGRDS